MVNSLNNLKQIIRYIKPDIEEISSEISLIRASYLDSIDIISFFVQIEEKFQIQIELEDMERLSSMSLKEISNFIDSIKQNGTEESGTC